MTRKETLEKWNQWLLLLSHIGIMGGLVLVGLQLQQNTQAIRAQEMSSYVDAQTQLDVAMLGEEFTDSYVKALLNPADLSPKETYVVVAFMASRVNQLRRMFDAYRSGTVDEDDWNQQLHEIPIYLGTAFGREFWDMTKVDHVPREFVRAVDKQLQQTDLMADDLWLIELNDRIKELPAEEAPLSP